MRGGKRKGAGRHPKPDKKETYSIRLRPDLVDYLRAKANASKWLEETIDKAKK